MAVHAMEERENTKASLKAWWSAFTKVKIPSKEKKSPIEENRVFGVPLRKSLKYASVAISMAGDDGNQYVWGYVPVIVAKVGLYLKENGKSVVCVRKQRPACGCSHSLFPLLHF